MRWSLERGTRKFPFEGVESQRERHSMVAGCTLQRLFSTFPDGWPGFGLLLLRLSVGIAVICFGTAGLSGNTSEPITVAQHWMAVGGGVFLLAGLWTPLMGVLVSVFQVWGAVSHYSPPQEYTWIHVFLGILSVCVAMLGPGAWSIDARLFGRKRFDIDRMSGKKPSL